MVTLTAAVNMTGVGIVMSFASTGGTNDVGPSDPRSLFIQGNGIYFQCSATYMATGLSPGDHTFTATAKFRSLSPAGPISVGDRSSAVAPLT